MFCLALSACQQQSTNASTAPTGTPAAPLLLCATGGGPLTRVCSVERYDDQHGGGLIVYNVDGGFHRLRIVADGRGVASADGAVPASVSQVDADHVDVTIGEDRYRLPATVKRR